MLMGGNVAEKPIANPTILAVFSGIEDRTSLVNIFVQSGWEVRFTCTLSETQAALRASPPGVILSDSRFSDGRGWSDMLNELQKLEDPPPLIVADRLADEHLWAEVLNLGAYDLLTKPFAPKEVLHAVSMACRRRESEQGMGRRRKPATPARHVAPAMKITAIGSI
jgi:DNA-binding response OmpR family regulator